MTSTIGNDNSCLKHLHSCFCLKSLLTISQQVHPTNPSDSKHSEFLVIDNKKTLRIIHVKPEAQISRITYDNIEKRLSMSRHSLTEEYWFTRWSKPLRAGSCNCSFRRSQRYSRLSNQFGCMSFSQLKTNRPNSHVEISNLENMNIAVTKITNIDTFVERLVQETYFEALREFLIQSEPEIMTSTKGYDNLAYKVDNFDDVMLRNKLQAAMLHTECVVNLNSTEETLGSQSLTVQSNNKDIIVEQQPKNVCLHKNNSKKVRIHSFILINPLLP